MRLEPFADLLSEAIGLDPAALGERGLSRAVTAAMSRAGTADPGAYLRLLSASPQAKGDLIREAVVPETWFFRDREPFWLLRERLRTLKRRGTTPRLLSAPCATGEEAYSLAITCLEAGLPPGGFHLTAVDVSPESLAVAARGRYGRNSFREDMPEADRHFIRQGDDERTAVWAVRPEVAATVDFLQANIVSERFLCNEKPFDIIFSRNFLIYLNKEARKRLMANIGRLLAPDGILFVGHSEILSFLSEGYQAVRHPRAFACCRETARPHVPAAPPRPESAAPAAPGVTRTRTPPRAARPSPSGIPACGQRAPDHAPPRSPADVSTAPAASRTPGRAGGENPLEMARRLADHGELAEAAAVCRRCLEADRHNAEAYFLLGLVGAAEHRVQEARALFQKALYLEPGHAACLTHLALIHEQLGDAARADIYRQRLRRLSETGGTRP
ncbi:MAG: CheR family methyltransferase [Desulfovibrionaceae bacterium]|nr:CheR family methyltransferase [Desulfovibrionaceae bacterium]